MASRIHVLSARITANAGQFVRGVRQAEQATRSMRQQWGEAARAVGSAAQRITIAAGVVGGVVIREFANFEDQVKQVGVVTGTLGTKQLPQLREAAIEMGEQTQFSAQQAAQAIEQLGLAGIKTSDITGGALKRSLELAGATGISIADAANIAATNMKLFKLEAQDLTRVNDALVNTQANSLTNIRQLAEALKFVGGAANNAGLTLEQTTAILGKLADAGARGTRGGTALRRALVNLTGSTTQVRKKMEELGVQVDATFFEKLDQIREGIQGLSKNQKEQALTTLFGARAFSAFAPIVDQGAAELRRFTEVVGESGTAAQAQQARLETLKGTFQLLISPIRTLAIRIGGNLAPAIERAANQLKNFVTANRPQIVQQMSGAMKSLVDVAVNVTKFMAQNAEALFGVAGAIGRVVGAVVRFVAQRPALAATLGLLKAGSLLGITQAVRSLATAMGTTLVAAVRGLQVAFVSMGVSARAAWASATLGVSLLIAGLTTLLLNLDKVKAFFKESDFFEPLIEAGRSVKREVLPVIKDLWAEIQSALSPVMQTLGSILRDELLPLLTDLFKSTGKSVAEFLKASLVPNLKAFAEVLKILLPLLRPMTPIIEALINAALMPLKITMKVLTGVFKGFSFVLEKVTSLLEALGVLETGSIEQATAKVKQHTKELKDAKEEQQKLAEGADEATGGPGPDQPQTGGRQRAGQPGPTGPAQRPGPGRPQPIPPAMAGSTPPAGQTEGQREVPDVSSQFAHKIRALRSQLDQGAITVDQFRQRMDQLDRQMEMERFTQRQKELRRSFREGDMTADEFRQSMSDLQVQMEQFRSREVQQQARQREAARGRFQQATENTQDFARSIKELQQFEGEAAQAADGFFQRLLKLRREFTVGAITQDQFAQAVREMSQETEKAINAEQRARKQRIVRAARTGQELSEEDRAFVEQRVAERRKALLTKRINTGFDNLVQRLTGVGQGLQKMRNGMQRVGDQMGDFGKQMRQQRQRMQNVSPEQIRGAANRIFGFLSRRRGLIVTLFNRIQQLEQILSLENIGNQRRLEVQKRIEELMARLVKLVENPPEPAFINQRFGFQGIEDPGLQTTDNGNGGGGGSSSSPGVGGGRSGEATNINLTIQGPFGPGMADQLIDEIELALQRRGKRLS